MISDSCWFAFCFAYSVENRSERNRFITFESSIYGRPPWRCSLVTLAGHIQTQTQCRYLITQPQSQTKCHKLTQDRHWSAVLAIWLTCWLRSELLLHCADVSFKFSLPWASWVYYFYETKIICCIFITESWFWQTRKQQLFHGTFYKYTVRIIWTYRRKPN